MAFEALWLQNVDYPARQDRLVFDTLWTEGIIGSTSLAVTQSAVPAMTVQVAAGTAVITGDNQAFQGKYIVREQAATTGVAIGAAPGSGTRYDLVVVQVRDPNATGPAGDDAIITVVAGTPSGSPVDPALPASAIPLARVRVPSGTGTITNALIDDLRYPSAVIGGPPSGSIMAFAGTAAPAGWLLCNGSTVTNAQTLYPALWAVMPAIYKSGANLVLPDLRGRVPYGQDATADFSTIGGIGGSKTSTAPHTHGIDHDHAAFNTAVAGTHNHAATGSSVGAGSHTHTLSDTVDLEFHVHSNSTRSTSSTSHTHTSTADVAAGTTSGSLGNINTGTSSAELTPDVDAVGDHTHGITVTVTAGQGSHDHSIDVPAFVGTSGVSSAGASSGNLPPYLVVNYIIKV